MKRNIDQAVSDVLGDLQNARSEYTATRDNRFTRRRTMLGGSGDSHYGSESFFERVREYARDMDRNDGLIGPITDRAVTNALQSTGFIVEPDTGDDELNEDIKYSWREWCDDKASCDFHEERTFWELCYTAMRSTYIDGDMLALFTSGGSIQLVESDRLQTPGSAGKRQDIVYGVELQNRRKVAYWIGADPGVLRTAGNASERFERFDSNGYEQIVHLYNPHTVKRVTQTRGISAFAPVYDRIAMYEDRQFATLVQQLTTAAVALFIERGAEYQSGTTQFGPRIAGDDGSNTKNVEKISPGQILRGAKGEKPHLLSSNTPSPEVLAHSKQILAEVSINLGVPLVLALMDASETNFSGWRGAMDMARMGFRVNQKWFVNRFVRPAYLWQLRNRIEDGEFGVSARRLGKAAMRHSWGMPAWPYIQPLQDAQADGYRLQSGQLSPSKWAREHGLDWEDHVEELVRNWKHAIIEAKQAAEEINESFQTDHVHWRDLLNMHLPNGLTMNRQLLTEMNDE